MNYNKFLHKKITIIKDIGKKQYFYTGKVLEVNNNKIGLFDRKIKKVVYINMDNASIIPKE